MVVFECHSASVSSYPEGNDSSESAMALFLHCNSCYFRPGSQDQRRFFITNCSHIYCENCVTPSTKECCKVCNSKCTVLCLSGKIPKEVENMFTDPLETFQKNHKEFVQKYEFQRSHHKRLVRYLTQQHKVMNNIVKQAQKLEKEYLRIKAQNDYLQRMMPKNCPPRGGSRSGTSPGPMYQASPSGSSPAHGRSQNFTALHNRPVNYPGSGAAPPNQHTGRLLIRTPPSGGRLGTTGSMNYPSHTPGSLRSPLNSEPNTPLTCPRPISFGKSQ